MSAGPSASYWSATAHVGRGWQDPIRTTGVSASYWSATADIGREDRVSLSRAVTDAAYYNRRNIPPVINRGDAGSAYEAQKTIARIESARPDPYSIIDKLRFGDDRSLDSQDNFFVRLKNSLTALGERLAALEQTGAFNPNAARSSDPEAVQAEPGAFAGREEYSITVERLAAAHQAASDSKANPFAALGLSGSFKVNGYTVTVTTADSLADLRDKINRGEDTNNDGELAIQGEDINGNGSLDFYYQPAVYAGGGRYLPAFHYFEDTDKDGQIGAAEDTDGDKFMTGGSAAILAKARIEDNRLVIKNMDGADKSLRLDDPDNILGSLGFYKTDDEGEKQLKTSIDSDYHKEPVTSKFTIDGKSEEFIDNVVESAIPDVVISFKKTTSRPVTVKVYRDTDSAVGNVLSFAASYNSAISLINQANLGRSPVRDNVRVQDLTVGLALAANREVKSVRPYPASLRDIGLAPADSVPRGVDIAALENIRDGMAGDKVTPFLSEPGLMARLHRLGIASGDDFTLTVDEEKLAGHIGDDPGAVHGVFNAEADGVSSRLGEKLGLALDETKGMIATQRTLIGYYKKNGGEVNKLMEKKMEGSAEAIRAGAIGSIFGSVVA